MPDRVDVFSCPHCHTVLAKVDRRDGANILPTKVFKVINGNTLVFCKTCKTFVAVGGFNPLGGPPNPQIQSAWWTG